MNLSFLTEVYTDKYQALQAAKWLQKNLKNSEQSEKLSQDIQEFENNLVAEHRTMLNKCPNCKINMQVCSRDILECPKCGLADTRKSYYHQPTESYLEELPKLTHKPEKHFANWLNDILAINTPKGNVLPQLVKYFIQNDTQEKMISPEDLRKILKQLKLPKYYKHTSYLYKELTNVGPPFIPHDIINTAKWYFKNINETRERLSLTGNSKAKNNPGYPYLIYKIFDLILPQDDIEKRRILNFIHLPSEATLLKRNQEWKLILDEFIS